MRPFGLQSVVQPVEGNCSKTVVEETVPRIDGDRSITSDSKSITNESTMEEIKKSPLSSDSKEAPNRKDANLSEGPYRHKEEKSKSFRDEFIDNNRIDDETD